MEYTICNEIEHGLFFTLNTVRSCGIGYNDTDFYWFQNYNGELIDTDLIEEKRKNWRERFLNHTEPEQCKNCHLLLTKDWKQDGKFNLIVIAHRSNCSCNCIYCNFSKDKNYWNNRESYNIVPVLEDLRDRNLLAENLMISICGGECTEYPNNEFENIMEFIIKQKCKL